MRFPFGLTQVVARLVASIKSRWVADAPALEAPVVGVDVEPELNAGGQAVENRATEARYRLGERYSSGHGVKQDQAKAVWWWREAADRGHAGARYNLGNCYLKGLGVKVDLVEAYAWFLLARERLPSCCNPEDLRAVWTRMSARDLAAAKNRAEELRTKSELMMGSKQGLPSPRNSTANPATPKEVAQDLDEAIKMWARLGLPSPRNSTANPVIPKEVAQHLDEAIKMWARQDLPATPIEVAQNLDQAMEMGSKQDFPSPRMSTTNPAIPKEVAQDLDEAKLCFSMKCYCASALMARRVIQSTCIVKGTAAGELPNQISELARMGVITKDLRDWATAVRWVGNDGGHPSMSIVSKEDAEACLRLAEQFTQTAFVRSKMAKALRAVIGVCRTPFRSRESRY